MSEIVLRVEFDLDLNARQTEHAAEVFSEQLTKFLTNKDEPWGYGRARVVAVVTEGAPF